MMLFQEEARVPTENFKSEEAYRKSRAYTHIHGIPTHAKDVVVAGKKHKVKHGTSLKGESGRTAKYTGKRKTRKRGSGKR